MKLFNKNHTWELVPRLNSQRVVDYKWIYKVKEELSSKDLVKFKARLVATGFTQVEDVNYNDIFSHVVKYTTIKVILALIACFDWELEQLNVKITFLHRELEETIYMNQLEGFEIEGKQNIVCCLRDHYIVWINLLDSGIKSLIALWQGLDLRGVTLIVVYILKERTTKE